MQPNFRLRERIYTNNDKSIAIFKTRRRQTIKFIAVKVYSKKRQPYYNKEYLILKNFSSKSIIKVYNNYEDEKNYYMEMEYCASSDLSQYLWSNKHCNYFEKVIKVVSTQILLGLKNLHLKGILHCNLKPSNIIIDEFGNVKICDLKKALNINEMSLFIVFPYLSNSPATFSSSLRMGRCWGQIFSHLPHLRQSEAFP